MQASPDAVLEPRDSLTQIVVQNAQLSRVLSLAMMVVMVGNQWREGVGRENLESLVLPFHLQPLQSLPGGLSHSSLGNHNS